MADDDADINYKEMAFPKQGVYKQSPAQEVPSDSRHPHPTQPIPNAHQSGVPPQQQGAVPVRPSRSRHHGANRKTDPGSAGGGGGIVVLPAGSRGPRSLYLRRESDSFGFTLRHFIVYPPDSIAADDGRHAAVGALREPMETIFVKQVYENSPAHKAGLHHGDRLVSVNGYSLNGKSYAQVVQLIQNSPPYLHLLVVPKEDDVLQKFFPETAHNPETNQRPRYSSPETYSPRRQQQPQNNELLKYRPIVYPGTIPQSQQQLHQQQLHQQPQYAAAPVRSSRASDTISWRSYEEPTYSSIPNRNSLYQPIPHPRAANLASVQYPSRDSKSSEQLYSVPKDSLSQFHQPAAQNRNSFRDSFTESGVYSEPYAHDLSPRPRAQPQVPGPYRNMGRRASEGSNISDNSREVYSYPEYPECVGDSDMVVNSSKMKSASKVAYPGPLGADNHSQSSFASGDGVPCGLQGLSYGNSVGCRLSLDGGRRESSASLNSSLADGSKDSLSSFDSASTLTGQDTDDSIIMTRFRKSFEKKEEFLRRPSQSVGWKTSEDSNRLIPTVIQREFYSRPQKLQKEWPPNEAPNMNGQESPNKTSNNKPSHQNLQRVKVDIDLERDYNPQNGRDVNMRNDMQLARNKFYEGATSQQQQQAQFAVGGLVSNIAPLQRNSNIRQSKDKSSFVTTLSRIHEGSVGLAENGDERIFLNGSASLPVEPNDQMSLGDDRRLPLPATRQQIVSKRTKQFELGRPVPEEEDGSLSDRTNFYRSELSRLSAKRVEPNVAVRKREFETLEIENNKDFRRDKDMGRRTQRESRSLDNSDSKTFVSGNRANPIGSKHLHCLPPGDYKTTDVPFEHDNHVHLRARSNSAESWAALQNSNSSRNISDVAEDKHRNKVGRQDSYLSAVKSTVPDQDHTKQSVFVEQEEMEIGPHISANLVPYSNQNQPLSPVYSNHLIPEPVLHLQQLQQQKNQTPIVSITPATPGTPGISSPGISATPTAAVKVVRPTQLSLRPAVPLHTDSSTVFGDVNANRLPALPVSDDVPPEVKRRSKNTNSLGEEDRATRRVSYLKATCGDRMNIESDLELSDGESPQALRSGIYRRWKPPNFPTDINPIRSFFEQASTTPTGRSGQRQGTVACKILEVDGKRANDRSWHKVWAVLKGPHLRLLKDRHHLQSPMGLVDTDQQLPGGVDMRYSVVNVADDYTKRKNVLRISAAYPYRAELLLQADSPVEMADWVRTLQEQTGASTEEEKTECMSESKQAQPQQTPATTSIQVQGTARLSPQPSNKSKLSTFRNRSPTGQSPKSKTWRGRMVKQFKRLNQGSGSPNSPTTPEKLTFGVPLEHCQKSIQNEFVPRFVEMCTEIIEERGLEVVGIYRVPGNNAAVSALTEELNKGINLALQDVRSSDTNVVSSLLKSFFRKLPDSLLTSELYPLFIEADKFDDPKERLSEIKKLLNELPDHQYSTLKHLILHLKKVVDNSEINKMEARNLAIVFGPTLVRNVEDNMVTMVTDMSHQCRIVESLLLYAEWFFSDDDAEVLSIHTNIPQDVASVEMDNTSATVHNSLLLGNISKIEGKTTDSSAKEKKDIMSSIISAANKKIQRKSRKTADHSSNNTKEEATTPTSDSKDTSIVPLLQQADEQKQISLDSEESSTSSDNIIIPEDPFLMTYPQLEAKTNERVERFRQETIAMLQQKRRSDSSRNYIKPCLQNGDQAEISEHQTSSDLLATITSAFDNKIKALQSPTHNCLSVADNFPYADESPDVTLTNSFDTTVVEGAKTFNNPETYRLSSSFSHDKDADKMSPKSFRNPSLHKNLNFQKSNGNNTDINFKLLKKNNSCEDDHQKEKDVDEPKPKAEVQKNAEDELNELCKINFSNFIINKELKCSASDSKLKRSESLNKSDNRDSETEHGKLKRSVSLNRAADRLKRSDSLTKYEKTESNINLRRELADDTNRRFKKMSNTKLKRKNGMPERSIKRRHTVGGTKDFDRVHWLDNRLRDEAEETACEEKEKLALRSSSPDLSSGEKIIKDDAEETKPLESHI